MSAIKHTGNHGQAGHAQSALGRCQGGPSSSQAQGAPGVSALGRLSGGAPAGPAPAPSTPGTIATSALGKLH